MKKLFVCIVAAAAVVVAGCRTTNSAGQSQYDPVKTEQVKAAVEVPLASLVRRAITDNPNKAAELGTYFRSLESVFCRMRDTGKFEPSYLISEVDKLTAPLIKDDLAIDAKNLAVSLYRIFYADRNNAQLSAEKWPYHVSDTICNAIKQGLKDAGQ